MKSTISYSKFLAGTLCVLALAGCDSIKNVADKPLRDPPVETVSLNGNITGLSSRRAITLTNNGDNSTARSFIAGVPGVPNAGATVTPFSFGALPTGSTYNVQVKDNPFGKTCTVVDGQGTLAVGLNTDIKIACTDTGTPARLDMTVNLPANANLFSGLTGARVRLTTEEQIYEKAVTPGQLTVVFPGALINSTGQANLASWTITASTTEGGRLNKCVVTLPAPLPPLPAAQVLPTVGNALATNDPAVGAAVTNQVTATANVNSPYVGTYVGQNKDVNLAPCQFPIQGYIGYSKAAGTAFPSGGITGLRLELRDPDGLPVETTAPITCTPANGNLATTTVNTAVTSTTVPVSADALANGATNGCLYQFVTPLRSSPTSGLYDVAVVQDPVGMRCLMVNGGGANVFTTGITSPLRIIGANVFCRNKPTLPANQLKGVFRLKSSTWTASATATPVTVTYQPFNLAIQNTASNNMIAFFPDGTFLYGTHGNGVQVEHGFYDYDDANHTLRFTLITDTNTSLTFPLDFSPNNVPRPPPPAIQDFRASDTRTTTPGLSATPNPIRERNELVGTATNAYSLQAAMTGVTFGQVDSGLGDGSTSRTITGTFGADPAGSRGVLNVGTDNGVAAAGQPAIPLTPCSVAAPCFFPSPVSGGTTTSGACTAALPCVMLPNGNRLQWVLEEPPSIDGEMTGAWSSEDGRRLWSWDYRTVYGIGVGVVGGSPSMNDACFAIEEEQVHEASGFIVRRPAATGCQAWNRLSATETLCALFTVCAPNTYTAAQNVESVDFATTAFTNLPGYTGRFPGGEISQGTSSVSPNFYYIAPAGTFFEDADPIFFPQRYPNPVTSPLTSMAWCNTEILAVRRTSNGFPVSRPVYMCRE